MHLSDEERLAHAQEEWQRVVEIARQEYLEAGIKNYRGALPAIPGLTIPVPADTTPHINMEQARKILRRFPDDTANTLVTLLKSAELEKFCIKGGYYHTLEQVRRQLIADLNKLLKSLSAHQSQTRRLAGINAAPFIGARLKLAEAQMDEARRFAEVYRDHLKALSEVHQIISDLDGKGKHRLFAAMQIIEDTIKHNRELQAYVTTPPPTILARLLCTLHPGIFSTRSEKRISKSLRESWPRFQNNISESGPA